jgi:hypothetical protein
MTRQQIINNFKNGNTPDENQYENFINGAISIDIPKPEIKIKQVKLTGNEYCFDNLFVKWAADNIEFLNHNPEIWIFVYRSKSKKLIDNSGHIKKRKWSHCPHLNGINFPSSNFYSGTLGDKTKYPVEDLAERGRKTEFALNTTQNEFFEIPFIWGDWFYCEKISTGDKSELTISTDLEDADLKLHCFGANNSKSINRKIAVKLAIVIDNYIIGDKNPKIIGPMSDKFYFKIANDAINPRYLLSITGN